LGFKESVSNQHGGINPTSKGIDIQDHGLSLSRGGFIQDALHKRREPQIDDALDGHNVYDRLLFLGRQRFIREDDPRQA
jgi:hypothetical protein